MATGKVGEIVLGDPQYDGRPILYVVKANQTNYINYIKPLMLAEELQIPHQIAVINTKDEWYGKVHPERFVPCIRDRCSATGKDAIIFESTACLQYLADQYDKEGIWHGRNAWEKAQILSWTAYQTAGLGATAKFWLYFRVVYPSPEDPEPPQKAVDRLHKLTLEAWTRLNERLSPPEQQYVGVPDRPTVADLSYLPFAMPWMFSFFGVDIKDWPHVAEWAEKMLARPAVAKILAAGPTIGH